VTPLALTEEQLKALRLTAASLPVEQRNAFLQLVSGIIDVQPVNDSKFAEALDAALDAICARRLAEPTDRRSDGWPSSRYPRPRNRVARPPEATCGTSEMQKDPRRFRSGVYLLLASFRSGLSHGPQPLAPGRKRRRREIVHAS
jgi:hypothetical protein